MELTQEQVKQVVSLKEHFPFRICYGALDPKTGEFEAYAAHDKRRMNKLLRDGWLVFRAE